MRRIPTKDEVELLLGLIKNALQGCKQNKHKSRGRPVKYPDEIIILSVLLKLHIKLPFRDIENYLLMILDRENVPDFSSIFYRLKTFDSSILECIITKIAHQIQEILNIKEYFAIMADGTGFGYDDTVALSYLRGKELRKVKSHIKTEILTGKWGRYTVCLAVKAKQAYSDEVVMLNEIINQMGDSLQARYFIADGYYGRIELIKHMEEERKIRCIIAIKEPVHKTVRDWHRRMVKSRYDKEYYRQIYRKRSDIERFIGNIKNRWGDRDRTRIYNIAVNYVLMRFILWNIQLYLKVKFLLYLVMRRMVLKVLVFSLFWIF